MQPIIAEFLDIASTDGAIGGTGHQTAVRCSIQ